MRTETAVRTSATSNRTGYRNFPLGSFKFSRDDYFVQVSRQAKGQTLIGFSQTRADRL